MSAGADSRPSRAPRFNAQTAVDDTAQVIVATEVGNDAADVGQLLPMLKAVTSDTGRAPERLLATAARRPYKNLRLCKEITASR